MNIKLFCIISLLLALSTNSFAQKTSITFVTDKDCEVFIYEPIDASHNTHVPKSRLVVTNSQAKVYETKVSSYIFVFCRFPQYQRSCNIILFPNDSIQVHLTDKEIIFQGNNYAGQQYLYDNFEKEPFLDDYLKIERIFKEYLDKKRDLQSIIPAVNDSMHISSHYKNIENLALTTNTTAEFSKILKTYTYMFFSAEIVNLMNYLRQSTKKYPHIAKDSIAIENMVDNIFKKLPANRELMGYSSSLYIIKYFSYYYNNKECPPGYDPDTFGPYKIYLYASEDMHPGLLGNACMVQLKYDSGEMNLTKLKQFFNEKFPESEYTAIINERVKEENDSIGEPVADLFFIKDKIDFLTQLKNVPELEGKYLYIDLWASWCMPCRAEFSYKEQVHQILESYKNVATVYISIDYDKQEKAWQNCIKHYKLGGFHLRASSTLQQDIHKQVYGTDRYDIPRYVLISPTGVILHKDLPRPSDYPKLKETLDKLIERQK